MRNIAILFVLLVFDHLNNKIRSKKNFYSIVESVDTQKVMLSQEVRLKNEIK